MAKYAIRKKNRRCDEGFTLLEILAALLLIGLVLPPVMKGVSLISLLASDSERRYEAMGLAEAKLAEVLLEQSGQSSSALAGRFDGEYDEYEWAVEMGGGTLADVQQVEIVVFWQQRNRLRELRLTTLTYNNAD